MTGSRQYSTADFQHRIGSTLTQKSGWCSMRAANCAYCFAEGDASRRSSCTTYRTPKQPHSTRCSCLRPDDSPAST